MKKFLTEYDEICDALSRVRMDENVMPYVNGRLVEDEVSYNKIQKLLNCNEMEAAHKYLYDLDIENLEDNDIEKINKLFDIGVKNGFIDNSFEEELQKEEAPDAVIPAEVESPDVQPAAPANTCWTILYSATKNGETKCGECYSTAISASAAKADCLAKLAEFGYQNVAVLAVEANNCTCSSCIDEDEDSETDDMPADDANTDVDDDDLTDDADVEDDVEDDTDATEDDTNDNEVEDSAEETEDDDGDDNTDSDPESDDVEADDTEADDTDAEAADDADDADDTDDDTDGADEDGDDSESEELTDEMKSQYKDEYRQIFKKTMLECGFEEKSFDDLSIDEKIKFFKALKKTWTKNEPTEFMSDKEREQLDSMKMPKA